MDLDDLNSAERLRLMRFVCSFAWADLEVADGELALVSRLAALLNLSDSERAQVEQWLRIPPAPEEVDPTDIPAEHRELFLHAARRVIGVDGVIDAHEVESFRLFQHLLGRG